MFNDLDTAILKYTNNGSYYSQLENTPPRVFVSDSTVLPMLLEKPLLALYVISASLENDVNVVYFLDKLPSSVFRISSRLVGSLVLRLLELRLFGSAIECLKQTDHQIIGPLHCIVLRALIHARHFTAASELIDFIGVSKNVNLKEILLVYHYAGLIFTALERYNEASQYFLFNTQINCDLSQIQIESFKFLVMVCLILGDSKWKNAPGKLQKYTSEYIEFVQYKALNPVNEPIFRKDGTLSLARIALESEEERKLLLLSNAYLNLPLDKIPVSETKLQKMITEKKLFAEIQNGLVVFTEPVFKGDLLQEISNWCALCKQLQERKEKLMKPK